MDVVNYAHAVWEDQTYGCRCTGKSISSEKYTYEKLYTFVNYSLFRNLCNFLMLLIFVVLIY